MDWTWAILLLLAGLVITASVQLFSLGKPKSRKMITGLFSVIAIVGFLGLGSVGVIPQLNTPLGGGPPVLIVADTGQQITPTDTGVAGVCPPGNNVEDTTVTLSAIDKFTGVATGGTHLYKVNGAPTSYVANAGTFTGSPGDRLNILWLNETGTNYFSKIDNVVIPCAGTKTFSAELIQDGTLTIQVFNEEGNVISATENETLGSGDVVTLKAILKPTYQTGFMHGGVLVFEYNTTGYDKIQADFGTLVATPVSYSPGSTTHSAVAYAIPAFEHLDKVEGNIILDVAGNDPTAVFGQVVNATFIPKDIFVNEDKAGAFEGPAVDDEDNIKTFNVQTTFPIFVD